MRIEPGAFRRQLERQDAHPFACVFDLLIVFSDPGMHDFKEKQQMATEEQKKQAQFWLEYSQHLSGTIRYTEALAAVERSLALDDTSIAAWYAKGTYLAMIARYEEALATFEYASGMDDTYAPAWDGMAWALGILGRREEALAAVNRALELDPEYFDAIKRKRRLETL